MVDIAIMGTDTVANNSVEDPFSSNSPEAVKFKTEKLTAINIILLVVAVWIILSLFAYGKKQRNLFRCVTTRGKMYIACTVTVIVGTSRLPIDIAMLNVQLTSDSSCEWMADISSVLTGIAAVLIYLVLWYRQRCINSDVTLQPSIPMAIKIMSFITPVVIIAATLGIFFHYTVPVSHTIDPQFGCSRYNRQDGSNWIFPFVLLLVLGSSQLLLLFLFIYPMYLVRRKSQTLPASTGHNSAIAKTVKRSLICFVLVFLTDVITTVLNIPPSFPPSVSLVRTITNIDISMHQIIMIGMFDFFPELMCYLVYRPTTRIAS